MALPAPRFLFSLPCLMAAGILALSAGSTGCGPKEDRGDTRAEERDTAAEGPAQDLVDLSEAGTIRGTIRFEGEPPARQRIPIPATDDVCFNAAQEDPKFREVVVVNENATLRDVLVTISSGLEGKNFPVPEEPLTLDQVGCIYKPHVSVMMVRQRVRVKNSDPTLHNVRSEATINRAFNFSQARQGQVNYLDEMRPPLELRRPETIRIVCDVHGWMEAWLHVLSHPCAAVSGRDGSYTIANVPPGDYTVEAKHRTLGSETRQITVEPNGVVDLDFTFQAGD